MRSYAARRRRLRGWRLALTMPSAAVLVLVWTVAAVLLSGGTSADTDRLLLVYSRDLDGGTNASDSHVGAGNCSPRSISQFPPNFMSLYDTQHGGLVAHLLIALYMFMALAVVCDDYFVPSLEKISEGLGLRDDVAGATFMAAGSSAPELFTAIIGVFIANSDVGLGTIVGSAVFNILFIPAVCALFTGMVIYLNWWPLLRDCSYYLLSIVALISVIYDSRVEWYEALAMFLMYIFYIGIMYFNKHLEKAAHWLLNRKTKVPSVVPDNENQSLLDGDHQEPYGSNELDPNPEKDKQPEVIYEMTLTWPGTTLMKILWVVLLPLKLLLVITVPDCRRPGIWQKLYLISFVMSIVWIALFSYLMVWMVTIVGDAINIPDVVIGLTLLAAGTSVPDCLASLFVARDGLGDMAVSNSIGSNIFDILMCLGFPWLIKTTAVSMGSSISISTTGITYISLTLLSTVVFLLISLAVGSWTLKKIHGFIFMFVYVVLITFCCLYELNVFGDFSLPPCPRP